MQTPDYWLESRRKQTALLQGIAESHCSCSSARKRYKKLNKRMQNTLYRILVYSEIFGVLRTSHTFNIIDTAILSNFIHYKVDRIQRKKT